LLIRATLAASAALIVLWDRLLLPGGRLRLRLIRPTTGSRRN